MGVVLRDVVEKVKHMEMKMLAGKEGLDNIVTWVHMVESAEISNFLEGGEIAFTTGIGLDKNLTLLELVQSSYENSASAMIINIGPFIEEVPKDVVDFAEKNHFPLYAVPWNIHMAEIMRIVAFELTIADTANMDLEISMKNAILMPKQADLYLEQLQGKGFEAEWKYRVAIIELFSEKTGASIGAKYLERSKRFLQTFLRYRYANVVVIVQNERIILSLANYNIEEVRSILEEVKKQLFSSITTNFFILATVGGESKNIYSIAKSYNQALKMFRIVHQYHDNANALFYDDLGIYKILLSIEDEAIITEFVNETVEPIIKYDQFNQADLFTTLATYLKHSGSVKETATEMFVHRNTVNYKIKKLEELLNVDFSLLETQTTYAVGIMLHHIYKD